MQHEKWAIHPIYREYEISDHGNVRTLVDSKRYRIGDLISQSKSGAGYLYVTLFPRRKCARVNRLVLEAFVGIPAPGHVSRHLNGVKDDNRLDNLAWGTSAQNSADMVSHGNSALGSRNGNSKLNEHIVSMIKTRYALGGVTQKQLAAEYGTNQARISYVVRKGWRHV